MKTKGTINLKSLKMQRIWVLRDNFVKKWNQKRGVRSNSAKAISERYFQII